MKMAYGKVGKKAKDVLGAATRRAAYVWDPGAGDSGAVRRNVPVMVLRRSRRKAGVCWYKSSDQTLVTICICVSQHLFPAPAVHRVPARCSRAQNPPPPMPLDTSLAP